MKVYVSYVVQDRSGHKHDSSLIEITCPPYNQSLGFKLIKYWIGASQNRLN